MIVNRWRSKLETPQNFESCWTHDKKSWSSVTWTALQRMNSDTMSETMHLAKAISQMTSALKDKLFDDFQFIIGVALSHTAGISNHSKFECVASVSGFSTTEVNAVKVSPTCVVFAHHFRSWSYSSIAQEYLAILSAIYEVSAARNPSFHKATSSWLNTERRSKSAVYQKIITTSRLRLKYSS